MKKIQNIPPFTNKIAAANWYETGDTGPVRLDTNGASWSEKAYEFLRTGLPDWSPQEGFLISKQNPQGWGWIYLPPCGGWRCIWDTRRTCACRCNRTRAFQVQRSRWAHTQPWDQAFLHSTKELRNYFENISIDKAVFLAERVSGDNSVSHAVAFCQAMEKIAGINIPPRAKHIRTILLELERIYNHLGDIAGIATDGGFFIRRKHMRTNSRKMYCS